MEKVFKRVLSIILITTITTVIALSFVLNHLHSRVAMVTEIDETENLITVTCANGNMFQFYDTEEDWMHGDLCSMIMYDKGTELVYDDIVVSTRYGGFLESFEDIKNTIANKVIEDKTEVYVICKVVGRYSNNVNGYTYNGLICEMPDGELRNYPIEDASEGNITLVCLKTENQDDYSSYNIVAIEEFDLM